MTKTYLVPGLRTPFVKARTYFQDHSSLDLSIPVVRAMVERASPDCVIWGQVIPSPTVSNLGRELLLDAGLNPNIPGFTSVLACSTSMLATIQAAQMLGRGGLHLALVGGVETMSHVPIALKPDKAQELSNMFMTDPAAAQQAFNSLEISAFDLPVRGWANRISGRSMGDHTEDTAKYFDISRESQDEIACKSHKNAIAAQNSGFFDDLLVPFADVKADSIPRGDSTMEALAKLKPVFDRSENGTLTAANSSPLTDGAAGLWVADAEGLERMDLEPDIEIIDWQISAMDYREEGILMAPARAIPILLHRNDLSFSDIDLWEIHEAFAAQILANIQAISDPEYRRNSTGIEKDFGEFPMERLNPNGGSLALGHPFGATGARILSQAAKQLSSMPKGNHAVVSICADGGQGSVMLLRRV